MRKRSIVSMLLVSVAAAAQSTTDLADTVDVIVRFKASPDNIGHRRFAAHGAVYRTSLSLVGAHVYTVKNSDLSLLSSDPAVDYIGLDHNLQPASTSLLPDYGWLTALSASSMTSTLPWDGTGIGVAVIDS